MKSVLPTATLVPCDVLYLSTLHSRRTGRSRFRSPHHAAIADAAKTIALLLVAFTWLGAGGVAAAEKPERSGRFPKQQLDALAESFAGRLGFFAKDLRGGVTYSWKADERFPPASVIKLPVMVELYRQAAAGRIDLDQKRRLPDGISTHGTGMLKGRKGPVELSLREYCRLMMVHSDNMATDLVIRTVGADAANQFLDQQGFKSTRISMEIGRWHYAIVGMTNSPISRDNDSRLIAQMNAGKFENDGLGYSDSMKNNVCGPRDIGLLLERLYRGKLSGESETAEMLNLMRSSTHKQTIAKYVKDTVRVANKYGGSQRISADVGIVELTGRPVIITGFALAGDAGDRSGRETLARMARLIIAAVDPEAVTAVENAGASQPNGPSRTTVLGRLGARIKRDADGHIVMVNLQETKTTDDDLPALAGLDHVVELSLHRTRVTSAGLVHIRKLGRLKRLFLTDTKVEDEGLAALKELRDLELLGLSGTNVSDVGLKHLQGLKNLKSLFLLGTRVTDAGAKQLQQSLPQCEIVR